MAPNVQQRRPAPQLMSGLESIPRTVLTQEEVTGFAEH